MMNNLKFLSLLFCFLFICVCVSGCTSSKQATSVQTTVVTSTSSIATSSAAKPVGPLPHFIGSANLAGANAEAATLKTAVNTYYSHYGIYPAASSDLVPTYITMAKAKYYFNDSNGSVSRVDAISGGWSGMVFSLSAQTWTKGSPDNNHPDDLDIP